jgi:DnaJ-class molecular chaperone
MSDQAKCEYCFGTGQNIEMRPVRFGRPLPPYQPCLRCEGTGKVPPPAK